MAHFLVDIHTYGTACPWWINKEDRLILGCTKFGDHHVWLDYLIDHYFEPEGYNVQGVLIESGEGGPRDIISVNNDERGTAYVWTADMLTEAERKAIRKYADKYKNPLP